MIGNNKLIVSHSTIKQIVQQWLERELVTCNVEVDYVDVNSNQFEIALKEKENSTKMLNEG